VEVPVEGEEIEDLDYACEEDRLGAVYDGALLAALVSNKGLVLR